MELFRKMPERSNTDNSLGISFCRVPKSILLPQLAARLLVFIATVVSRVFVFKITVKLGRI